MVVNEIIEQELTSIQASEKMKELLEFRLVSMRENYSLKSEYEKNEIEITRIRTEMQIDRLNEVLKYKKMNFKMLFDTFVEEMNFEPKTDQDERSSSVLSDE